MRYQGEEVGGIVKERIELDAELAHDDPGELVLDRAQRLELHTVHLVPAELRGQLLELNLRKEPREGGLLRPSGPATLGARTDGPIECRQQQRRADRQSPGSLGHVPIDDLDHAEPIRRGLQ